jgi:phosphomethylpyrimidine synthase
MTQLESALKGITTKEMKIVAKEENVEIDELKKRIANGLVVIPSNINHKNLRPIRIGFGLRVKVNANIGTSPVKSNLRTELKKLKVALDSGADTIMDLSTSQDVDKIRKCIIRNCNLPLGTVPIYQTAIEAKKPENMDISLYLEILKKHAKDGVDFITVHAGVTKRAFQFVKTRLMKCVSRGGSLLLQWMKHNKRENFLYENFEDILEISKKYDITISLGDGLRPGCIADSTDKAQIEELKILGKLARKAREEGVQVIIEGPGHIPLNEIEKNVKLEKKYCDGAPFYVLGPLPTDIAAGYDHIACAIGGALAAFYGADFLCYVTPKEHIGLPDVEDVKEGVIAAKLAAHIADIARGNKKAILQDYKMSKARMKVNWDEMLNYVIDKEKFIKIRKEECRKTPQLKKAKYCSLCGPFCVFK